MLLPPFQMCWGQLKLKVMSCIKSKSRSQSYYNRSVVSVTEHTSHLRKPIYVLIG